MHNLLGALNTENNFEYILKKQVFKKYIYTIYIFSVYKNLGLYVLHFIDEKQISKVKNIFFIKFDSNVILI